ncbi:MAG TPA: hypothetical protein VGO11_26860 [Chthoniobacteraceae bacterium]|jgi:hypothetical protein|nr:hypothetical protein [Chthoniobacteraceae bacterium]
MSHTTLIKAEDFDFFAITGENVPAVITELILRLVNEIPDLTSGRIPYGRDINQPGWDGIVETASGFRQFVPKGRTVWEVGTGNDPRDKATREFKKRTGQVSAEDRAQTGFVFVTPRRAASGGWNLPSQETWIAKRAGAGWQELKILDATALADWLIEFPSIARWFLVQTGVPKAATNFSTPFEHWEHLSRLTGPENPPLPSEIFLHGKQRACAEMERLMKGELSQVVFRAESEDDVDDFIAAFIASSERTSLDPLGSRCLLIRTQEAWRELTQLRSKHVLVAHPRLDLEAEAQQLHIAANGKHSIVLAVSGAFDGAASLIQLRSPSASVLEEIFREKGFAADRARELSRAGAGSLVNLKRHLLGLGDLPPYATWQNARLLGLAGLVGRWRGENPADQQAMEALVGKTYGEWINLVRPETLRLDTPLVQRNEHWKIVSRGEAWNALGPQITNDDLERFKKTAILVLGERDPKFELDQEDRVAASFRGIGLKHSSSIREGFAETIALIGSRRKALRSCTQGRAETTAILIVRELLAGAEWLLWCSLGSLLPLLAEGAPDEFLDAVESALSGNSANPFPGVFAQEHSGISGWNHMSGLLWALEALAWNSEYLLRVTSILGDLAALDPGGNWTNRPISSLGHIFLPWYPQTAVPVEKRTQAVELLVSEQPSIGWKLLMGLLPSNHGITTGSHKPTWRNWIPDGWSDGATNSEYWRQVFDYADIAIRIASSDLPKLAELIDHLPNLPKELHIRILSHLGSEEVVNAGEEQRRIVWEALVDLSTKHRKYADCAWAMPAEAIERIEETASKIAPKSPEGISNRLFSDRDFDLYDEKGEYEEQRQRLDLRRQEAVQQILQVRGLAGVVTFAKNVGSPSKVGESLGRLETSVYDTEILPNLLNSPERPLSELVRGFVWGRHRVKGWSWADSLSFSGWTSEQMAEVFALLPFAHEIWSRAESQLGEDANLYWARVNCPPWGEDAHMVEAAERLLRAGRPRAAVDPVWRLVYKKTDVPIELAIQVLLQAGHSTETGHGLDSHEVQEIIAWLQGNPDVSRQVLMKIEWMYLPLLDHEYGGVPVTLEASLSRDAAFFADVVAGIYRERGTPAPPEAASKEESNRAQGCYRLLQAWKTVPGSDAGKLDVSAFQAWLDEAKRFTKESGRFEVAMIHVGTVLSYAPADPEGLWIHRAVAGALNAKDAGEMRSGFTTALFNRRGVHGFTAGEEERKLASAYRKQAEELDQAGFSRFATALRELAHSYEREAERESTTDHFE